MAKIQKSEAVAGVSCIFLILFYGTWQIKLRLLQPVFLCRPVAWAVPVPVRVRPFLEGVHSLGNRSRPEFLADCGCAWVLDGLHALPVTGLTTYVAPSGSSQSSFRLMALSFSATKSFLFRTYPLLRVIRTCRCRHRRAVRWPVLLRQGRAGSAVRRPSAPLQRRPASCRLPLRLRLPFQPCRP